MATWINNAIYDAKQNWHYLCHKPCSSSAWWTGESAIKEVKLAEFKEGDFVKVTTKTDDKDIRDPTAEIVSLIGRKHADIITQ